MVILVQHCLSRFYLETLPEFKGVSVRMEGEEFRHMTRVLRLGKNDRVELFNGRGGTSVAEISGVSSTGVELTLVENLCKASPEQGAWEVVSAFAALKGGRADWLVEKCTELGAKTLTPLLTERSIAEPERRIERWQRVVVAATKQCNASILKLLHFFLSCFPGQRLHTMELKKPLKFHELIKQVETSRVALLAAAGASPLAEVLCKAPDEQLLGGILIVGPEGDFTVDEKQDLILAGATPVGLGPQRLRVETATIAMVATVTMLAETLKQRHPS